MLAVAVPAPLRPTLLAVHSCTRQHANLLVPGQIVSGLVDITNVKTAEEVLNANDLKHGDKFDVIIQSQIPPYYKYISKCVVEKSRTVYTGNKCVKRKRNQQNRSMDR
jgi:hypothetical protein